MAVIMAQSDLLRLKYTRANALVSSVLNKYHNGSARAVDPFVIRCLQEHETHLFSIQCYLEQVREAALVTNLAKNEAQ